MGRLSWPDCLDASHGVARGALLLGRVVEDRRAVLRPDVGTLPVPLRRVVHGEEGLEQLLVGDLVRVVLETHRLGVTRLVRADLLVGGLLGRAAGVADLGRGDAGEAREALLDAPEAAGGEGRDSHVAPVGRGSRAASAAGPAMTPDRPAAARPARPLFPVRATRTPAVPLRSTCARVSCGSTAARVARRRGQGTRRDRQANGSHRGSVMSHLVAPRSSLVLAPGRRRLLATAAPAAAAPGDRLWVEATRPASTSRSSATSPPGRRGRSTRSASPRRPKRAAGCSSRATPLTARAAG